MRNEELKKIWEKLPIEYYEKANLGQKLWHNLKLKKILTLLPDNENSLLDVGCCDGYFLSQIKKAKPELKIWGVDVSSKLIKAARNKYPQIKFRTADAHKLPFLRNQFDLVLSTETLEHVLLPSVVLSEMKRVTKRGGRIIIEIDSGSMLFRLIFGFWTTFLKGRVWQGAHLHSFDIRKLEKLFKKEKLKVVAKYISHLGMAVTFVLKRQ